MKQAKKIEHIPNPVELAAMQSNSLPDDIERRIKKVLEGLPLAIAAGKEPPKYYEGVETGLRVALKILRETKAERRR